MQGFGYTGLEASLYAGYPYFAALGLLAITSTVGDKYRLRGGVAIFNTLMMLIGFISKSWLNNLSPLEHA